MHVENNIMTLHFLMFHFCIYSSTFCAGEEYILQPNPVVVIINPLSQFSLVGENAVLYCHINLTSDSQIKVDWRYNGQVLISDGSNLNSNHISISHYAQENLYTSKLYIQNVSVNDEGYYECLVSDGLYISGKSGSAMVTVSDRALLRIIDDTIKYREWTNIIKNHGQYVFLLCGDDSIDGWDGVLWNKNGLNFTGYMTSRVKELSNGSLLIYNLTMEDEGVYECSFIFSGYLIEGPSYNVSITMNASGIQEPQIFIDPVNITVSVSKWSSVTCYILGVNVSEYTIVWSAENGTLIQEDFKAYYSVLSKPGDINEVGKFPYKCEVNSTRNYAYLSSTIWVRVESVPVMTSALRIRDLTTSKFVHLDCPVLGGSNIAFTWYRNGVNITSSSNSTGYLEYEVPINSTSVGIYQCFIQNHVGSDTSISRLLEIGFANPPENFVCYAEDQFSIPSNPKIVLRWSPPNLINTKLQNNYYHIMSYFGNKLSSNLTNDTSFEINLEQEESNIDFNVSLNSNHTKNVAARCTILNTIRRRLLPSNVQGLEVTCPNNESGTLKWKSPAIPFTPDTSLTFLEIFHRNITCLCLQGKNMTNCANTSSSNLSNSVSLSVDKKFANSLCIFGGNYSFNGYQSSILNIPPHICDPYNKTPLVNVSCTEAFSSANFFDLLSFDTPNGTVLIDGHCICYDSLEVHRINFTWSTSLPKFTIEESILNNSLCSFIANSSGSSVIYELQFQCALGVENKVYYFPSTTPEPTTEPGMEGDIFVDFPSTTPEPATEPDFPSTTPEPTIEPDFPSTTPEFEPTTKSDSSASSGRSGLTGFPSTTTEQATTSGHIMDKSAMFNQVLMVLIIVMVVILITTMSLIIAILLCVRHKIDTNGKNMLHKNIADVFKESDSNEIYISEFEPRVSIDEDEKSIFQYLNDGNCESIEVCTTDQHDSMCSHMNSSGYDTESYIYHVTG